MFSVNESHATTIRSELPEWTRKLEEYERLLADMIQRHINDEDGPTEAAVNQMIDTVHHAMEQVRTKQAELRKLTGE